MAENDTITKNNIFPTSDSPQEVLDEAVADLPITTKNQLVALLKKYQNTLLYAQGKITK